MTFQGVPAHHIVELSWKHASTSKAVNQPGRERYLKTHFSNINVLPLVHKVVACEHSGTGPTPCAGSGNRKTPHAVHDVSVGKLYNYYVKVYYTHST